MDPYETLDQGLLDYDYLAAHQPGAQHAPYAFLSGELFSADINRIYESLSMPVWLAYGTRGQFSDVDAGRMSEFANWSSQTFDTGGIPTSSSPKRLSWPMTHSEARISGDER